MLLVKFNANGELAWFRHIDSPQTVNHFSQVHYDRTCDCIYTLGTFFGSIDVNTDPDVTENISAGITFDFLIHKIAKNGDFVFYRHWAGAGDNYGTGLTTDQNGNIYISGKFSNTLDFDPGIGVDNKTSTIYDAFIISLDSNGNYRWGHDLGSATSNTVPKGKIAISANNNIYLAGSFTDTVDFDNGGAVDSLTPVGGADAYLVSFDTSGNYRWVKQIGGDANVTSAGVVSLDSAVYWAGNYTIGSGVDLDPGPGTHNASGFGGTDVFLVSLQENGDSVNAAGWGTDGNDNIIAPITIAQSIFISGSFNGTGDIDPGPGTLIFTDDGNLPDSHIISLSTANFALQKNYVSRNPNPLGLSVNALSTDNGGNLFLTGVCVNVCDLDFTNGESFYTPTNLSPFVIRMSQ